MIRLRLAQDELWPMYTVEPEPGQVRHHSAHWVNAFTFHLELTEEEYADLRRVEREWDLWQRRLESYWKEE